MICDGRTPSFASSTMRRPDATRRGGGGGHRAPGSRRCRAGRCPAPRSASSSSRRCPSPCSARRCGRCHPRSRCRSRWSSVPARNSVVRRRQSVQAPRICAVEVAIQHRAAADDDGGEVGAGGAHQRGRGGLVAVDEQHDAVERLGRGSSPRCPSRPGCGRASRSG